MTDRGSRSMLALYRGWLALLPADLRSEFGADMVQLVADRRREIHGLRPVLGFWLRCFVDVVARAAESRWGRDRRPLGVDLGPASSGRVERVWRETTITLRNLVRRPGFAVLIVAIVALGIGLNTALFSVVRAILVAPLPFDDADRLTVLTGTYEQAPYWSLGLPEITDIAERAKSLDELAAFTTFRRLTRTDGELAEALNVGYATSSFFSLLGTRPALGRLFLTPEDIGSGGHPVAVLSHGAWQRSFGGDPGVVGRTIDLAGAPYTIVGVLPERFAWAPMDLWLPMSMGATSFGDRFTTSRGSRYQFAVARLADGVSVETAQRDLDTVMAELAREHPEEQRARGVRVHSLRNYFFGSVERPVQVLFAGAMVVLLICCVNVAALFLARGLKRRREMAIRTALGASRGRLVLGSVTESLALTLSGGVLGAGIATWSITALTRAVSLSLPAFAVVTVDRGVLGVAIAVTLLTGLVLGLVPGLVWPGRRPTPGASRGERGGPLQRRGRGALVSLEVAVAMVLLVCAGLTAGSLRHLAATDMGFDSRDLLTLRLDLRGLGGPAGEPETRARVAFADAMLAEVEALPGVRAATVWGPAMLGSANLHVLVTPEGASLVPDERSRLFAQRLVIGASGLETLGARLVAGRGFTDADRLGSASVVMVDRSFAETHYPQGAVGRTLHTWRADQAFPQRIVGVVDNVRHRGARNDEAGDGVVADIYRPFAVAPPAVATLLVRYQSEVAAGDLLPAIQRTVASIAPAVAVFDVATMDQRLGRRAQVPQLAATLMGVYAAIAALFACVGVYAVLAYAVRQQRGELAVRAALGAQRRRLQTMIFGQGMQPVLLGLMIGLVASWMLTRGIESLLFGITRTDPGIYVGVAVLVAAVSALACWLPARQATRADPANALREE